VAKRAGAAAELRDAIDVQRWSHEMTLLVDDVAVAHGATFGLRVRRGRRQAVA
jgi:hypothetical protein